MKPCSLRFIVASRVRPVDPGPRTGARDFDLSSGDAGQQFPGFGAILLWMTGNRILGPMNGCCSWTSC